jgi:maltose-binding protein MalE
VEEENYGWLFVETVPLLYNKKRVAKQQQIETWLDLYELIKELDVKKPEKQNPNDPVNYVV